MKANGGVLVTVLGLACFAVPLFAHHGFDTEYDQSKKVSLTGVVTKVSWLNPHMRIFIDVTNKDGSVTNWNLELTSPNNVRRQGWGKNDLLPGDKVNFEANPGKLVESRGALRLITKAGENKPLFVRGGPEAEQEGYKSDSAK
jgi:Family of unknown function (DUF6152)